MAFALVLLGGFGPARPVAGQGDEIPDFDLASLFVHAPGGGNGNLLLDENEDGVPDRLGAAFVMASEPSGAERMAAAEIAARLGFETMALDLPLARRAGLGREDGAQGGAGSGEGGLGVRIVIGRRALAEAGLTWAAFGAPEPAPGEGAVATLTTGGVRWLAVAGGGEDGLLRAARTLAGALPWVGDPSGPSLEEIGDELAGWLEADPEVDPESAGDAQADAGASSETGTGSDAGAGSETGASSDAGAGSGAQAGSEAEAASGRPIFGWAVADVDGNLQLGTELEFPVPTDADDAFQRLERLAASRNAPGSPPHEADSLALRFAGVSSVVVSSADREVVLPTLASLSPPGPIPGRPGSGAKPEMDLSNVYSTDGFLADSDGNEIPDRIDVLLVPDADARGVMELAARLGLESTGLTVPLLKRPDEIESPAGEPTTVLLGTPEAHPLIARLADSGSISLDDLAPGQGLVELVPRAFGDKPSLVATGSDRAGATQATHQLAEVFPYADRLRSRTEPDRVPTFDQIERDLWGALSGRTPAGQAAIGLYKLDRIAASLADEGIARAEVMVSLEKPDGDASADSASSGAYAALVHERAAAIGADSLVVSIDDRDVQAAATIFEDVFEAPSEVDRFWTVFEERVEGMAPPGAPVRIEARLSEPPEVRRAIAREARRRLLEAGADPEATRVQVLSAFKQGFSWLRESVGPRLADAVADRQLDHVVIEFLRNEPPAQWPQQAIHTPLRWLHEIFPIDEVLAGDLGLEPGQVRFEMVDSGPAYRVRALASDGRPLLEETFDPKWVLRPYFDRFRDYEQVRVTTGWITAVAGSGAQVDTLADERIVTDPEWFWDRYQSHTLPAVYDYVMDRHQGNPRGGDADAPFFGTFTVELEMSEPDYRLGVDNEIVSPMDALHEEVYFGTIEFFHLIGRNARGQDLTYPGRIVPIMRPRTTGADANAGASSLADTGGPIHGRIRLTGFATSRPAVVVRYETRDGRKGERRLDIPKIDMERPSLRRAVLAPDNAVANDGAAADTPASAAAANDAPANAARANVAPANDPPALSRLDFRVRVDSEMDERDALLRLARPEQVDERMISAQQVAATVSNLATLRRAGVHAGALAYAHVGEIGVWAEWTHEQDPEARTVAVLPANGVAEPSPVWSDLLPEGWRWDGSRIVQWDTPIPPDEGHQMLAKMSAAFEQATMYRIGESYLGRTTWAADLMSPVAATHWSRAKATTFKPTVVYSARQHANEVSSTSHVLRHAELLLTDSIQRGKLNKVNVVVHPFTNPDGAQLAYDLYRITPDFILHAGYLAALGMDATSGSSQDFPLYPEARVRPRIWERWLPDIFLNPHGYPSHQVVQLFSEYSGLVRRGRVTERNWGFNKGWFMPGFGYVDDPEFPRHKDAAFKIREYITRAINANRDVFEMNQRNYDRYRRYGVAFDPEVFRLPMTDSVLIEMPLKGSRGGDQGRGGFNPKVTIWSGVTEAPDETAYGPWMELVAKAGLSWDQAILDYLYDGAHRVERTGTRFFGGTTMKMARERPPKPDSPES